MHGGRKLMSQETVSVDYTSKNIFMPVQRMIKRRKRLRLIRGFHSPTDIFILRYCVSRNNDPF